MARVSQSRISCPHCATTLIREADLPFTLWTCDRCGGSAATLAGLRRGIRDDYLRDIWGRTLGRDRRSLLKCASCPATMFVVPTDGPEIDLCRQCHMVWFDAGELDQAPRRSEREMHRDDVKVEQRQWQKRRDLHWDTVLFITRRA